jgi:hypothetical protein
MRNLQSLSELVPKPNENVELINGAIEKIIKNKDFTLLNEVDGSLHTEIAVGLIDAGKAEIVTENLDKFQNLGKEVFFKLLKLIDDKQHDVLIRNLDRFTDLDKRYIALEFIGINQFKVVVDNLDKFDNLNTEIAQKLLVAKEYVTLAKNLDKFVDLDRQIAIELVENNQGEAVILNSDRFTGLILDKDFATELIKNKQIKVLAEYLGKFTNLDKEIAYKLIEAGYLKFIIEHLDSFSDLDTKIAKRILGTGNVEKYSMLVNLAEHLNSFSGLDTFVASELIEHRQGEAVMKNLNRFIGLILDTKFARSFIYHYQIDVLVRHIEKFNHSDHKEILSSILSENTSAGWSWQVLEENIGKFIGLDMDSAKYLARRSQTGIVIRNIEIFNSSDHKKILSHIITTPGIDWQILEENIGKFVGLDRDSALDLIKHNQGEIVIRNSSCFAGLALDRDIFPIFVEQNQGKSVVQNLDKFSGLVLDRNDALKFIAHNQGEVVINNFDKFLGVVLDKDIALELIEQRQGEILAKYLDQFVGLDRDIAIKLIEQNRRVDVVIEAVILNPDKFAGLILNKDFALKLIEIGQARTLVKHLDKFTDFLDRDVAVNLIKHGCVEEVVARPECFSGLVLDEGIVRMIIDVKGDDGKLIIQHNFWKFSGPSFDCYKTPTGYLIGTLKLTVPKWDDVAKEMKEIPGLVLDDKSVSEIIGKGLVDFALDYLEEFEISDYSNILIKSIKEYYDRYGKESIGTWPTYMSLMNNFHKFKSLNKIVSDKFLLLAGNPPNKIKPPCSIIIDLKIENLDQFEDPDMDTVRGLININRCQVVAENLEKIKNPDYREIAVRILEAKISLDDFHWTFGGSEVPKRSGQVVLDYFNNFIGVDRRDIAFEFIKNHHQGHLVLENLDKFPGLILDRPMALYFVRYGQGKILLENLDKFPGLVLDQEIALCFIQNLQKDILFEHLDKFVGLDHEAIVRELVKCQPHGFIFKEQYDKLEIKDKDKFCSSIGLCVNSYVYKL